MSKMTVYEAILALGPQSTPKKLEAIAALLDGIRELEKRLYRAALRRGERDTTPQHALEAIYPHVKDLLSAEGAEENESLQLAIEMVEAALGGESVEPSLRDNICGLDVNSCQVLLLKMVPSGGRDWVETTLRVCGEGISVEAWNSDGLTLKQWQAVTMAVAHVAQP